MRALEKTIYCNRERCYRPATFKFITYYGKKNVTIYRCDAHPLISTKIVSSTENRDGFKRKNPYHCFSLNGRKEKSARCFYCGKGQYQNLRYEMCPHMGKPLKKGEIKGIT